jgi:hypothetical protein
MSKGLYESFNARNHTPADVAKTFIANDDYWDLWRKEHTVVLGPRGSGKTTLFKMLTIEALYTWEDENALKLRKERPFTAIYVPTDMHWHHQLKHAGDLLKNAPRFVDATSLCAVTTSVFQSLLRTFSDRVEYEQLGDAGKEAELCKLLIDRWQLPSSIPCFQLVGHSLKARIADIRLRINEAIFSGPTETATVGLPSYYHIDYFACMDLACTAFDRIYGLDSNAKWALCFDELELAPQWFQELVFSQQRSADEKYLIKLSTSPLPSTLGTTGAHPRQDVRLICIWNHTDRKSDAFADTLARSVLSRRLGRAIDPEALFGRSGITDTESADEFLKYTRNSPEWRLFLDVASWDASFAALLERFGINPQDPYTEDVNLKDSILRKAKPVASLRQTFLKPIGSGRLALRSRKVSTIYFGKEVIYRVSDGNPRRLIGIINDIVSYVQINSEGAVSRLSPNLQADVLMRASAHFSAYIHALPGSVTSVDGSVVALATILQAIATYFRQRLLGEEFLLDPPGSFTVDSNTHDDVIEILRLGVYHGAIVYVNPPPDTIDSSLRGKRFRLSYMMAPLHKLPLTLNTEVSLRSILATSTRMRIKRIVESIFGQGDSGELPLTFS